MPHIRLTALALLLLGAGLGFLGILVLREGLASTTVAAPMAIAAVGALCALVPGRSLAVWAAHGKATQAYLTLCGIGAAGGMVYLSTLQAARPVTAVFFSAGVTCGACWRLSLALVLAMLPPWRPAAMMGICGASLGLGGALASLVSAWIANPAARADPVLLSAAAVPLLLAVASIRAGSVRFEAAPERWGLGPAEAGSRPRGILISASLLLQATACGLSASWLTSYLSQRAGFSLVAGAAVMALFWLGLAFGWAIAERLPTLLDSVRSLAAALALTVAGVVSLLYASIAPLAVAGVPVLGLATGLLSSQTLRLGHWSATLRRSRCVLRSLHSSLVVALVGSWGVGALGNAAGAGTPVWMILGCILGAAAALVLLVADYRISGDGGVV